MVNDMYDMTKLREKTFDFIFIDGREIHVFSPTLKARNEIISLFQDTNNYVENLPKAISKIISNNREKIDFSSEEITEKLTENEMTDLIDHFTNWLNSEMNEKN